MKDTILAKLSWIFAHKYRSTLLLWAVLLAFGSYSYTSLLKKEGFPPINLPVGAIQGTYFADDAVNVDANVVQPIAKAVKALDIVDDYQAVSGPNFFNIFTTFSEGTDSLSGTKEVQSTINDLSTLPEGVEFSVTAFDPSKFDNKYNMLLAVYSEEGSDYQALAKNAQGVADALATEIGIESVAVIPVVESVINPATGQSVERQTSVNKVALATDADATPYPAVSIGVAKVDSVDDVELSETVKKVLERLDSSEFKTVITADNARTIDEQLGSLQTSLMFGLIAVIIITLLFISWRAAVVIALFIPIVVAATFGGLFVLGYSLNTITLFAIILTLGLFVDDATIIVEAIDAHRKDSKSHKKIIKSAINRIGIASFAGTLTTLLVFTPMLFVSGVLGSFIKLMPVTVIMALSLSFTIAMLIVPFMTRLFILRGSKKDTFLDKLSILVPAEKYLAAKLATLPLLFKSSPKRGRAVAFSMVGLSFLAVFAAAGLAANIPLDIFPQAKDGNILQATVEFAPGTNIKQVESVTGHVDANIKQTLGEELSYLTYVSATERGAVIEIGLTPFKGRSTSSLEFVEKLNESQADIGTSKIKYAPQDAGPPSEDFPFQMRIYSQSLDTLRSSSEEISSFVKGSVLNIGSEGVAVSEVKVDGLGPISRTSKGRFATVSARFDDKKLTSQAVIEMKSVAAENYSEEKLSSLGLSEDALDFDVGQESENAESFSSIGLGLVIAMILMYVLLVVLFNSFSQPILILTAVPFSLFGVFLGLTITDNSLSFFVMLGLLGLIGIVVNNTILLTEYANQEKDAGADSYEAISRAIKDRFRPLLTTTMTTVFALLPLALNDPFWQALSYTLIFGMLSSTLLIILSFPYYYLFFEKMRDWKNSKLPALR